MSAMGSRSTAVARRLNAPAARLVLEGLAALALTACVTPATAVAQAAGGAQEADGRAPVLPRDFAPIRFGDDDAHAWTAPFFPGAQHDPAVPTPESFLGQPVGSRIASHDEM